MRILLDEAVPRSLGAMLAGHEAKTVPQCGWAGVKNGKLLALASTQFDAFLTTDQNIKFQQNLATLPLSILVVAAKSNRIKDIEPLLPDILKALNHLQPKALKRVGA